MAWDSDEITVKEEDKLRATLQEHLDALDVGGYTYGDLKDLKEEVSEQAPGLW